MNNVSSIRSHGSSLNFTANQAAGIAWVGLSLAVIALGVGIGCHMNSRTIAKAATLLMEKELARSLAEVAKA